MFFQQIIDTIDIRGFYVCFLTLFFIKQQKADTEVSKMQDKQKISFNIMRVLNFYCDIPIYNTSYMQVLYFTLSFHRSYPEILMPTSSFAFYTIYTYS